MIAERHARTSRFDDALFGEPAWAMLLDLYVAYAERRRIGAVSLCIASGAPQTTALRWIAILERQGLVTRSGDAADHRLTLLALTDDARDTMTDYLHTVAVRS